MNIQRDLFKQMTNRTEEVKQRLWGGVHKIGVPYIRERKNHIGSRNFVK
jgi:hypothetical protein